MKSSDKETTQNATGRLRGIRLGPLKTHDQMAIYVKSILRRLERGELTTQGVFARLNCIQGLSKIRQVGDIEENVRRLMEKAGLK